MDTACHCLSLSPLDNAATRPTSGRCLTPSVCHVPTAVGHGNAPRPFASTALTVLAIIGNRFKLEASVAFAPSVWMHDKTAYGKDAEAAHHLASMRKLIKAEMSSNAPSIG